ncbi:homoprotocatechuate degradation operon regulator, HpaR [Slackia heliotrinireducens]|jgi:DNA-binding MarR family transcriptional regulator|uniref:Transcriptional regulator n=1 Tax=Slackia heliotrinireducens (strain ATCC 29202 / DSM 20476 / NCTC 11029 / RHS 1) TaxID=471855 RepID=C7N3W0_SLAHD|nr:MarR family transcriptional regulator [Slackia heliotrinireducens]ACV21701.1 transcriptional regulator [Slackia heliotrinireducens DSM 20476]VEG99338.1 homoprotocatechuate degradation operon regulator, HpaR [Slackia heliotrinireducens]
MDTTYRELAYRLIDVRATHAPTRARRFIDSHFSGEDLVLSYLNRHGRCAFPKELGEAMDVTTARIAAILRKLEGQGLITRELDDRDGRKVVVRITQAGVDFVAKRRSEAFDYFVDLLECMGPEDAAEYVRLTEKAMDIIADKERAQVERLEVKAS